MDQNKEIISQIAGIEDWGQFEEFVKNLYAQNEGTLNVERNYKAKGKSGRNREVDVLVKFGFNPHLITLGVECKYWAQKVDGDIIDIAFAKKEDLKLDKYAVITTVGFEAGAELYAKNKGIDLFIIRPTNDDDFGYSGRIIKFKLITKGSFPTSIRLNGTVIADPWEQSNATRYLQSKLTNIPGSAKDDSWDSEIDLYRYTEQTEPEGMVSYTQGERVNNVAKLIFETWQKQNSNFWGMQPSSIEQKIMFKSPTAIFLASRIVVTVNEITFKMRYLYRESEFEIDRGEQYPLILENVIENAVTPLITSRSNDSIKFQMCDSIPKQEINFAEKPDDVVGREGVTITIILNAPMGTDESDPSGKLFEFVMNESGGAWAQVNNQF